MTFQKWKVKNKHRYEDQLLLKYWQEVGGLVFTEVTVGKGGTLEWPKGAKPRRIDAVRILPTTHAHLGNDIVTFDKKNSSHSLREIVTGRDIEVIEIKRTLDRVVLGQVIIGADLFELEYAPATIKQVVVCGVGDPVLELSPFHRAAFLPEGKMMVLGHYEVPVAYSMVALARRSSSIDLPALSNFGCYWMAFNDIYVTLADRKGRRRVRLKQQQDGSLCTRRIANVNVPKVVPVIREKDLIDVAFDEFTENLKDRLIKHPSVRFFVYRTPRWNGRQLRYDAAEQRLNGVLNVGYTVSWEHPVWSPIDIQLYERYMEGNQNSEVRDALAKQIAGILYTVRKNMFHGSKRPDDASDVEVVEKALPLLVMIVESFLHKSDAT